MACHLTLRLGVCNGRRYHASIARSVIPIGKSRECFRMTAWVKKCSDRAEDFRLAPQTRHLRVYEYTPQSFIGDAIRRSELVQQAIVRRPAHPRRLVGVLVIGRVAAKPQAQLA